MSNIEFKPIDETAPIPVPLPPLMGWICPVCKKGCSPFSTKCEHCADLVKPGISSSGLGASTNILNQSDGS